NPRFGQHPALAGAEGAAAHAVVARAERAADDHRELWDLGVGDGHHHLGAVLGDAFVLVLAAHHEAGDVLEEDERNPPLAAELDEVGPLQRRFGEEDSVVGEDTYRVAHPAGEPADQRGAVERLELMEPAAVHQAGDDLPHLERMATVGWQYAIQVRYVI